MKRNLALIILTISIITPIANRLSECPETMTVTLIARDSYPGHTYILLRQGRSMMRIAKPSHMEVVVETDNGQRYIIKAGHHTYYNCRTPGDEALLLWRRGFLGIKRQLRLVCEPPPVYGIY